VVPAELVLRAAVFFRVELVLRAPPVLLDDVLRAELVLREEEPERAAVLLPDEREPERAEERVVAGTAMARVAPVLSSLDASPMAESPHVASANWFSVDVPLSEPVLLVPPVPLQSSWVINDLLS
jgi:hypothetical protein